jgi:molybdopterin-guanine dinucleotide biosynthesis protein A
MIEPLIAVLAGGQSTRMGTDKAAIEIAGKTMAAWVVDAAQTVGTVIVVGRTDGLGGAPAVPDPPGETRGPLAGLVAALETAPGRSVVLIAVDQPWVRPTTLRGLIDEHDGTAAVVPRDDGVRQTTCALYPSALRRAALAALDEGASIQRLLDREGCRTVERRRWRSWGEDGRSWFSVDDPEALQTGLARFGPPSGI